MIAIFLLVSGTIDAGQSKVDLRKVKLILNVQIGP